MLHSCRHWALHIPTQTWSPRCFSFSSKSIERKRMESLVQLKDFLSLFHTFHVYFLYMFLFCKFLNRCVRKICVLRAEPLFDSLCISVCLSAHSSDKIRGIVKKTQESIQNIFTNDMQKFQKNFSLILNVLGVALF